MILVVRGFAADGVVAAVMIGADTPNGITTIVHRIFHQRFINVEWNYHDRYWYRRILIVLNGLEQNHHVLRIYWTKLSVTDEYRYDDIQLFYIYLVPRNATNRIFDQNGQNLCCSASLESKLDATTSQHAPPIHTVHTPIYRDTLLHRYERYEFRIVATGCLWRIASREHRRDLWSNPWRRQRIWNRWKVSIAGRESSSKRSSCSHPHFFLSCQSPYHFLLGLWYMR